MQLMLQQQAQTVGPFGNIDWSKPYTGTAPAGKYPAPTGKRYRGEFPGWVYDPFYDKYFPDQQAKTGYETKNNELAKGPSTGQQIGMALLGGGLSSIIPSLFGGGGKGGAGTPGGLVGQGLSSLYHSLFSGGGTSVPDTGGLTGTSGIGSSMLAGNTPDFSSSLGSGLSSIGSSLLSSGASDDAGAGLEAAANAFL